VEYTPVILIVDDEPISCETLEALLLGQGYHITYVHNGEEALVQALQLEPDLILLDVMMPGMDGFEVCKNLRVDPFLGEVPIIMITALDDRDSLLRAIEAGADDFVTKPFDRFILKARVKSIIRLNRYRRLLVERTYRNGAEEEIDRRNNELTLLNRVIMASAEISNTEEMLHLACEALAEALDLPQASSMLLDLDRDETDKPVVIEYTAFPFQFDADQASDHEQAPGQEIPVVGHLSAEDLQAIKVPMVVVEGQIEARLAPVHHLMRDYGLGALLIVPILIQGQVRGIIELKTSAHRQFHDHELSLAQCVATTVGQALETTKRYIKGD
jgi:DNA-binding response OmpR family regulator